MKKRSTPAFSKRFLPAAALALAAILSAQIPANAIGAAAPLENNGGTTSVSSDFRAAQPHHCQKKEPRCARESSAATASSS